MMRWTIVTILAVMSAGCTSEPDDKLADENPASPKARLGEEFDDLALVLKLSDEESKAFQLNLSKHNDALRAWVEGEKGQRLIALEAEIRIKSTEKDLAGLRSVIGQATPLRNEIGRLIESSREELLDSLGFSRRCIWEGDRVATALLELIAPLALDTAQESLIHQGAQHLIVQAHGDNEPNPKAATFLELEKMAEQDVLTPEQREAYQAIKKQHPMRSLAV